MADRHLFKLKTPAGSFINPWCKSFKPESAIKDLYHKNYQKNKKLNNLGDIVTKESIKESLYNYGFVALT